MGKLTDYSDFYGRGDPAAWDTALREFFALAAGMRGRLGDQGCLLDSHLQMLLSAAASIPLFHVSQAGFGSGSRLREAIRCVMREESEKGGSMFEKVKAYIDEHPLPWQEGYTCYSLYFAALIGDCAGFVVGST